MTIELNLKGDILEMSHENGQTLLFDMYYHYQSRTIWNVCQSHADIILGLPSGDFQSETLVPFSQICGILSCTKNATMHISLED